MNKAETEILIWIGRPFVEGRQECNTTQIQIYQMTTKEVKKKMPAYKKPRNWGPKNVRIYNQTNVKRNSMPLREIFFGQPLEGAARGVEYSHFGCRSRITCARLATVLWRGPTVARMVGFLRHQKKGVSWQKKGRGKKVNWKFDW